MEIPANPLGAFWSFLNIFGITFEPETLETWSRVLKTHILAQNKKKLRAKYWHVGLDDDAIKLTNKHVPIMIPLAQNHPPKWKFFFILN